MAADKNIEVGRQIHMPLGRAFLISVKSIKIRFWRSLITAAGIFLGIAFLVSVLTQMALKAPPTPVEQVYPKVFVRGMVKTPLDKPMEPGLTAREAIAAAGGYTDRADQKNIVVVKRKGEKVVLDFTLATTSPTRLEGGEVVFVPNSSGRLRQLVVALIVLAIIITGLVLAKKIEDKLKRIGASVAIVAAGLLIFVVGLAMSGLTPPHAPTITVVKSYHIRGEVGIAADVDAAANHSLTTAIGGADGFTKNAERKHVLLVRKGGFKKEFDLASAAGKAEASKEVLQAGDLVFVPDAATNNRQLWLVVMSLLVCTIGITNSMLMSVTERYKEIGTMKCLGALDKFVVELFLLESGLLGIFSSFAGWLVGFGVVVLLAVASQGTGLLAQMTLIDTLKILGIALGVGSLLTTIATIAPAVRAAQMPPAAALRVEI